MDMPTLVYPTNNSEGKISIRYYLNTDLKPKISESGEKLYPLYFKITVKRQATKGKSLSIKNMMTMDDFNILEQSINFHTLKELNEGLLPIVEKSSLDSYLEPSWSVITEKMLLYTIVTELNPFNKSDFDIKDVIFWFELYNTKISDSVNEYLKIGLKGLLEKESNSNNGLSYVYLRSLDWEKGNAYDLWYILKDFSPLFLSFFQIYSRCFQITANQNINNLSDEEIFAINEIADDMLKDFKNKIEYRKIVYKTPYYDSIINEILALFFNN
ncbi:hypothetical protein VB776_04525 [Arcicella sp. DC2W]|uniref:Uncharacterized protein n=1 Tax=Arcicella gelida TaxID=2984195 RepID=A0ABU5S118_9BACT|nr:hypothetical protein [Arcicella sp. DC2W]MEA5402163.1 hypothetical protein [Arcicella sp. DC2W]